MTTWALYMLISYGFGSASIGGPVVIDGYKTEAACKADEAEWRKLLQGKIDRSLCKPINKG